MTHMFSIKSVVFGALTGVALTAGLVLPAAADPLSHYMALRSDTRSVPATTYRPAPVFGSSVVDQSSQVDAGQDGPELRAN